MRFVLLVIAALLIVGCDYFDDDTIDPITYDSTPVILPADADWELIATLQYNPLRPAMFYVFDWQAINTAYLDGKHFIFEIGKEYRDTSSTQIRHYIIQPTPPFQDEDKHPGELSQWETEGVKFDTHRYLFLSEGWYALVDHYGEHAIGLGVEFDLTHFKPTAEFPAGKPETLHSISIGLINTLDLPIIGRGPSFIEADVRLRIYVSK